MPIQQLSTKVLRNDLRKQIEVIALFDVLIDKHEDILDELISMNGQGTRNDKIQTHQELLDDYKQEREGFSENVQEIRKELAIRGVPLAQSVLESSHFPIPPELMEGIFFIFQQFPKIFFLWNLYSAFRFFGIFLKRSSRQ